MTNIFIVNKKDTAVLCAVVCCMEVRPEAALQWADMRMIKWMYGIKLKDGVPSKGLRERD